MIKTTIAIYPGRFQPFAKHHASVFLWIKDTLPNAKAFIATSNVTGPKSPFTFNEKKAIISAYGFDKDVKQVRDPYKAEEITSKFDKNTTAVVFVVGKKDAERLIHGEYFIPYPKNGKLTKSYKNNGYVLIAPHISLNVPGYGEMSGTSVRQALGDTKKSREQRKKLFNGVFGWYASKLANMIFSKLEKNKMNEHKLFTPEWWKHELLEDLMPGGLSDGMSVDDIAKKHKVSVQSIEQQLALGIKIESEHTDSIARAQEIAMDHLVENPKYYTKLKAAHIDEMSIKQGVWTDMVFAKLDDADLERLFKMYQTIYAQQGLDMSTTSYKQLQQKFKGVWVYDVDGDSVPDAFICYKQTEFGRKLGALATNGDKEAKSRVVKKLVELTKTPGYFFEASKKTEEIMKATSAPVVRDKGTINYVVGEHKNIKHLGDGYYQRVVSGHPNVQIVKRLYGKPYVKKNESLNEGGAAGHMLHPFDLPQVTTGNQLIKVFAESVKSVQEKPAAVKIDGINTALKVVTKDNKQQFALDRGSMKPEDVSGITVKDLGTRFSPGHGMLTIGKKVLTAFNAVFDKIKPQLQSLGLLKNPNLLLNIETVIGDASGKTNVIPYKENFFVIHGLLKSENLEEDGGLNERRVQTELHGSPQEIEELVDNAKPTMKKLGFGIYGMIPTKVKEKITFAESLNTSVTIKYNSKRKETKTLREWLSTAKNPKDEKIKYADGRTDTVMTKKNYVAIINQAIPLDKLTTNPADQKKLVDGAIIYHATRLLGNEMLKKLSSDVGPVDEHEGIVIRDPKISDKPFKIVGEFIVSGLSSIFKK